MDRSRWQNPSGEDVSGTTPGFQGTGAGGGEAGAARLVGDGWKHRAHGLGHPLGQKPSWQAYPGSQSVTPGVQQLRAFVGASYEGEEPPSAVGGC